jgi:hypothetical protein
LPAPLHGPLDILQLQRPPPALLLPRRRPPSLGRPACYVLQRQHWRRMDPHFVQYSRHLQAAALERAVALGGYKAAMQLAPPEHVLPACLAGLEALPADAQVGRDWAGCLQRPGLVQCSGCAGRVIAPRALTTCGLCPALL